MIPPPIPLIDRALAQEKDTGVRTRMQQARRRSAEFARRHRGAEKIAAIGVIRARGDLDARSLLEGMTGQPPAVAAAATAGMNAIDHVLQIWNLLQGVFYGVSLGSVLLLAATGLAITFGVMGVINMAHGEMVMIGAYTSPSWCSRCCRPICRDCSAPA